MVLFCKVMVSGTVLVLMVMVLRLWCSYYWCCVVVVAVDDGGGAVVYGSNVVGVVVLLMVLMPAVEARLLVMIEELKVEGMRCW